MPKVHKPLGEIKLQNGNINKNNNNTDDKNSESDSRTASSKNIQSSKNSRHSKSHRNSKHKNAAYVYDSHLEEKNAQPLYAVSFYQSPLRGDKQCIFATAGGNHCLVYECLPKTEMQLLMSFLDPNINENFYTCAWTHDWLTYTPILATAGLHGIIRLLDVSKGQQIDSLLGHGAAINALKFHPTKSYLLLSASNDYSLRFWNIKTKVLIAIFSGVDGHRADVVSADFHISGKFFVSCGMDHSLKLWSIDDKTLSQAIEKSNLFTASKTKPTFPTIRQHYPIYSTCDVHDNYVNCVQWFQDFILSKSCENVIVCWKPGDLHTTLDLAELSKHKGQTKLKEFEFEDCDLRSMRFAFNPIQHVLALGDRNGNVNIWQFDPGDPHLSSHSLLKHAHSKASVHQVALSPDAKCLVYVCEDSTVWRWNKADPAM